MIYVNIQPRVAGEASEDSLVVLLEKGERKKVNKYGLCDRTSEKGGESSRGVYRCFA